MIPIVAGLASGAILLLSRGEDEQRLPDPVVINSDTFSHREDGIEVPLALTRKQWLTFLKAATCGNPRTVSPSLRLGVFGFSVLRLCDLGAMAHPRKVKFGERIVWDAHWSNPANLAAFQSAPMVQYNLFTDSIKRYFVHPEIPAMVGQTVDGQKISQSGALMLAHRAGILGAKSWTQDSGIRQQFSENTTAFFEQANGIF